MKILLAAVLALSAETGAFAGGFERPDAFFCLERFGAPRLSLFGCDDDISHDPFLLSKSSEEAGERLFPSSRYVQRHAATKFALLAGKFMGRVDAAVVGSFRLRFVVILE